MVNIILNWYLMIRLQFIREANVQLGINVESNTPWNTLLYADDQMIIQETEVYKEKYMDYAKMYYSFIIFTNRINMMAFKGTNPYISNLLINGKILEKVVDLTYLGCCDSFKFHKGIKKNLLDFKVFVEQLEEL